MHIVVIGLDYKTAPIEIREKVSFDPEQIPIAMQGIKAQKGVYENVLISTCNRTEVYAVVDFPDTGIHYITKYLADRFSLEIVQLIQHLYIYEEEDAIRHLFQVTCGLHSMVLGETQILGQIKQSFQIAQDDKTIGVIFNQMFKQAITLAKKAHSETAINTNAASISYAAVELAKRELGTLEDKEVLVLGVGEMGKLAVENLNGQGVKNITVVNRTLANAVELAEKVSGVAKGIDSLAEAMKETDILISSTAAKEFVLKAEFVEPIMAQRAGRPLCIVDIAVPRDVDPQVKYIVGTSLYDIDDLEGIVEANMEERKIAAKQIEEMISVEIENFDQWLAMLGVVPIIGALKAKADVIQMDTMDSLKRKLPGLTEREWKVINKHFKSVINQLLKDPILFVKDSSVKGCAPHSLESFEKIFNIVEEVEQQKLMRTPVIKRTEEKEMVLAVEGGKA